MTSIERNIIKNEEKIERRKANPKKYIATLKAQRTRLLNKECNTVEEFEVIQEKLNEIELQMKIMEGAN